MPCSLFFFVSFACDELVRGTVIDRLHANNHVVFLGLVPRGLFPLRERAGFGLLRQCGNAVFERFCRARLQAGTVDSSTCSPEGECYRGWRGFATQTLQATNGFVSARAWSGKTADQWIDNPTTRV